MKSVSPAGPITPRNNNSSMNGAPTNFTNSKSFGFQGVLIRVGLTGLTAESTSVTEARFMPCPNISTAARQIAQLVDRCKAVPSFKADPVRCAIAAYRGS